MTIPSTGLKQIKLAWRDAALRQRPVRMLGGIHALAVSMMLILPDSQTTFFFTKKNFYTQIYALFLANWLLIWRVSCWGCLQSSTDNKYCTMDYKVLLYCKILNSVPFLQFTVDLF